MAEGITELKAMLKDNAEASAILGNVEQTLMQSNGKVVDLEKQIAESGNKLTEAINSRDKIRNVVKNQLGIDEFTEDAIKNKLSSYASDDVIAARDKQFNDLRSTTAQKIEGLEGTVKAKDGEIRQLMLKLAISQTDVMKQTKGKHAGEMLLGWIAENAEFDSEGNITYRGDAGETLYNANGNPLTLEDRINDIKSDQSRDFVFQQQYLQGGGAPTEKIINGPAGSENGGRFVRSKMTFQEKQDYRAKYGEEAYQRLPLA